MKTKSALSWFGSDSEVAPMLARYLDRCSHVTIPFVGGASILPHLKARAIVANDLHALAINFYRVISGRHGEPLKQCLINQCRHTLSHPVEMERAIRATQRPDQFECVDVAWAFWSLCWLDRKGKGGTKHQGGLPSVRRTANGGTNASRISAAANDLEAWADQFKRCEWTQHDFRECVKKVVDRPKCGIYVDAPWIGAGRNYLHNFSEADHRDLSVALDRFQNSAVVVRYGDDPMLRELYPVNRWHWIEATSRTQANKQRGEVWIVRNVEGGNDET
jgi:site-specific DNA-adenine methylase